MIIVIGTGIIGLFSAYELIKRGFNVTLLDFDSKANASSASVGMLAPAIESKPMENKLLELMINSKKIWADIQKKNNISKMLEYLVSKDNNLNSFYAELKNEIMFYNFKNMILPIKYHSF